MVRRCNSKHALCGCKLSILHFLFLVDKDASAHSQTGPIWFICFWLNILTHLSHLIKVDPCSREIRLLLQWPSRKTSIHSESHPNLILKSVVRVCWSQSPSNVEQMHRLHIASTSQSTPTIQLQLEENLNLNMNVFGRDEQTFLDVFGL